MFKKIRSVKLPYSRQGLIYFTCRDYENQPQEVKNKIKCMCSEIGSEVGEGYSEALFEVMTDGSMSVTGVANKYFLRGPTLYAMRKKFYETW